MGKGLISFPYSDQQLKGDLPLCCNICGSKFSNFYPPELEFCFLKLAKYAVDGIDGKSVKSVIMRQNAVISHNSSGLAYLAMG